MAGKAQLLIIAIFLFVAVCISLSCGSDGKDSDGDDSDGDMNVGDTLDFGDAWWDRPPLKTPGGEGDPSDIDDIGDDGMSLDGDALADGDMWAATDGDDPIDGDQADGDEDWLECPEVEDCIAPAWCDDDSAMLLCSLEPDPDRPECLVQTVDEVICEDDTSCLEPDGDADFEVDCYSVDGDTDSSESDEIDAAEDEALRAREADSCPVEQEPVVLYMSNDDSNSMASPIYCRAKIIEGYPVWPNEVRIYEFLNYYNLSYENSGNKAASVSMQMRRTDADAGEFTLLLSA